MTNDPQNGHGWAGVTYFARASVGLEKFRHGTPFNWDQQCRQRRTSVSRIYGLRCYTIVMLYTKAQAPSVWFVVYLLETRLCYTSTTKSTKWSLGLYRVAPMYVLMLVCIAMQFKYRSRCSAIWAILCEGASRGLSALTEIHVCAAHTDRVTASIFPPFHTPIMYRLHSATSRDCFHFFHVLPWNSCRVWIVKNQLESAMRPKAESRERGGWEVAVGVL